MNIILIPGLRLDGSSWEKVIYGAQPVRGSTKIRDVEHVDLPTGHWPWFTRPEDLGRSILLTIPPADDRL